jgi:hypothetical protein
MTAPNHSMSRTGDPSCAPRFLLFFHIISPCNARCRSPVGYLYR